LGSAIASTILSLAALSVAGVDQVQAAVLTFNFQVEEGGGSGFFKLSNSSLTKTGSGAIAVSEGRFNTFARVSQGKNYYDLAGAIAYFYQGNLEGLGASGRDTEIREFDLPPDVPGGPYYIKFGSYAWWSIIGDYFWGYRETIISNRNSVLAIDGRTIINGARVSYTLVNTEPEPVGEPVPEPLTSGGTALALAGLSWLKHKKKMAA
jgi:hypothetical protein